VSGLMFYCEHRSRERKVQMETRPRWPRPESWQDRLWLLMTVAGVLLLVCAALSV
jgi:hypothetical protein